MKRLSHIPTLALIGVLVTGCSHELRVRTDFDKSVSIQRLTEYDWLGQHEIESRNNPLYYNELNDKRIKTRVDGLMKNKGYILSSSEPKILLHYHFAVEERSVYRPDEFGYSYNRYWLDQRVNLIRYAEGTLIIDFMDAANCNLIWRGWATSVLDDSRTMNEDLLNRAVDDIMKRFPDSAAKEMFTE
jgi:hypothetical protein